MSSRHAVLRWLVRWGGPSVASALPALTALEGKAFVDAALGQLGVGVDSTDGPRLPESGGALVVANHPAGALDALVVLSATLGVRDDVRLWVRRTADVPDALHGRVVAEEDGVRGAVRWLRDGGVLVVFPAGDRGRVRPRLLSGPDPKWSALVARLHAATGVPVVPCHIDVQGLRGPLRGPRSSVLRWGKPLGEKDIQGLHGPEAVTRYLRARVYALASARKIRLEWFARALSYRKEPEPVVEPVEREALVAEIAGLDEFKLFEQGGFACYAVSSSRIPVAMQEIGRLRELTFRAVAEGTNHATDIDEYDLYYQQLFLWHAETGSIAGAYRIGNGEEILRRYGHRGLYTSSLFRFARPFHPYLRQSMELGRSFVPVEFQKHRLPLFLLWKGILAVVARHPNCRYLIGPVSISAAFNPLSRWLMMAYIERNAGDDRLSKWIQPRTPYRPKVSGFQDPEALIAQVVDDIRKLDTVVSDIQPQHEPVPVLLKRYLAQNARILAFNHDPKFNDALDGFMLLDLHDLPEGTVDSLRRELA